MKLIDAPIGILRYKNTLLLKTEYWRETSIGDIPDCFILTSGECFWGGVKTAEEFNDLEVEPLSCCEDCINFYNNHLCLHWSKYGTIEVKPYDFCSYFEEY